MYYEKATILPSEALGIIYKSRDVTGGVKIFSRAFCMWRRSSTQRKFHLWVSIEKESVTNPSRGGEGFGEKSASRDLWTVP